MDPMHFGYCASMITVVPLVECGLHLSDNVGVLETELFLDAVVFQFYGAMFCHQENITDRNMTEGAGVTYEALNAALSDESKSKCTIVDLAEPDEQISSVTRKRPSSTPGSTGKRKKADTSAKRSSRDIADAKQSPISLRSSSRKKRTPDVEIGADVDEQQPKVCMYYVT